MYCPSCGTYNPEGNDFCTGCGAALGKRTSSTEGTTLGLPVVEDEVEEEVEVSPPREDLEAGRAVLVIKKGPDAGMSFTMDRETITIGRHPESDIFLDDITVSRRHAEIKRSGGSYTITDMGSLNGTYLNRERIESCPLKNGDEIQIGKYRMLFFCKD
jgi:hypothetical protein